MSLHPLHRALELLQFLVGHTWKHALMRLALATLLFAGCALLFIWLGFAPIAASRDHFRITQWFLGFAMRNAVETRSMGMDEPPLDDPLLVRKGAGHYATGCAPCHGAPGQARSPTVLQLVPEPPVLPPLLDHWKAQELFWIVRHGLKYTAMPGWASEQRDDEVWAVVAFLREMGSMPPERYVDLAYGGRTLPDPTAATAASDLRVLWDATGAALADCARCHGEDGNAQGHGTIPKLAGQSREYLLASLTAYAQDRRESGIMRPLAAALDAATMDSLAAYFAGLPRTPAPPPREGAVAGTLMLLPDPKGELALAPLDAAGMAAAVDRGAALAAAGSADGKVPACRHCHGPGAHERNRLYPELAGQPAEYLALQLALFRQGHRGGTAYRELMDVAAERLDAAQIRDLALYYSSLPPPP
jgi:cytochrome c553